ncbi:MAG: hypothetical protein IPJ66_13265 [Bacteroidetes bacterium]|nr:hypothetical protein [Bacteroidota bacterium]MBL0064177.1 hypothetical protein [Bacteroidota bacterium]
MIKTTTQKDLLLYVYNESNLHESDRVQRAIDGDPVIGSTFREIVSIVQTFDAVYPEPSEESIQKIMKHA